MKIRIPNNGEELDLSVPAPTALVVSRRACEIERLANATWDERMSLRARQADEDLAELLEYEVDEDGKKKSKITNGQRISIQQWYMANHPEMQRRRAEKMLSGFTVNLNLDGLKLAESAAAEMNRHMLGGGQTIETSAEEVKSNAFQENGT